MCYDSSFSVSTLTAWHREKHPDGKNTTFYSNIPKAFLEKFVGPSLEVQVLENCPAIPRLTI